MAAIRHKALLTTVEVAYDLDVCEDVWARRMLESAQPWLSSGLWSFIATYELGPTGRPEVRRCIDIDAPYDVRTAIANGTAKLDEATASEVWDGYAAQTLSQVWARFAPLEAIFQENTPAPARDLFQVNCRSPDGAGALLGAGLPQPTRLSRARRAAYSRVAAHVSSAYRLRAAIKREAESSLLEHKRQEAVLLPGGRLIHAEGSATSKPARERLRAAAIAVDRARAREGRADAEASLDAWQALVSGRWTVVEHFDSDGRRFLVAVVNPPELRVPLALEPREALVAQYAALGHTQKFIAYELGLHESTVSRLLKRALKHLGLERRADLAALAQSIRASGSQRGAG
ncbi:MAG: helix-turn-helix transcriptional regulator [Myxococcales bacterium]|nr:helix-turn-helix transcriptional regulator [Myxococcales bacterium]MCB9753741.1 helix-turn-helix transcriptional regulator [Myxococcales bacterium]